MSNRPQRTCAAVRRRSSGYLDGRLSDVGRRAVQRHLQECDACLRDLQQLARLSRAAHNLPHHRAPADLASRVRLGLAERRRHAIARMPSRRSRAAWGLGAAALLLATISWAAGYWMGQSNRQRAARLAERLASLPGPGEPSLRDANEADEQFVVTSQNVLRDLAILPRLPERAKRPMIAAQLAFFELPQRARPILAASSPHTPAHQLARFVDDLHEAVESDVAIDWRKWQQRASRRGLLGAPGVGRPGFGSLESRQQHPLQPARASQIVDQLECQLDPRDRQDLAELLVLKQEQLSGGVAVSLQMIEKWQVRPHRLGSAYAFASATTSSRTLIDAGRTRDAQRVFVMFEELLRQFEEPTDDSGR